MTNSGSINVFPALDLDEARSHTCVSRRLRAELLLSARGLTERDASRIQALLERCGLPTSDLDASQPQFMVLCEGAQIIGAGALQRFGSIALLRSVAVEPRRRGSGLGRG